MVKRGRRWKRRNRRGGDGKKNWAGEGAGGKERRKGTLSLQRPMVRREVCVPLKDGLRTDILC